MQKMTLAHPASQALKTQIDWLGYRVWGMEIALWAKKKP
jgi:hypothetical protein